MGFYIDYDSYDTIIRLSLSEYADMIIRDDINEFLTAQSRSGVSTFANIIFENFYETAKSSISIQKERLKIQLEQKINAWNNESEIDADLKKQIKNIEKNSPVAEDVVELLARINGTKHLDLEIAKTKVKGINIRINQKNTETLSVCLEDYYYDNYIAKYIKSILEEYAQLPKVEREKIFFKQAYDTIESAIKSGTKLQITLKQEYNQKGKEKNTKYYFTPYKIATDKCFNYNYLVGYIEEIKDKQHGEKILMSIRLSRIDKIRKLVSLKGFISQENKKYIDKKIAENEVAYISSELENIDVLFTPYGISQFHKQIVNRPNNYTIDNTNPLLYHFKCSGFQAYVYFPKFGKDAIILSPKSLVEKTKKLLTQALDAYTN